MLKQGARLAPGLVPGRAALAFALFVALVGCTSRAAQQPSTGIAYAGPANLKLRTAQGVEGWTDSNLLLTEQHMNDLRRLADSAAKLPSQGSATVYDVLNMHTEPTRLSPSFFQIPEGAAVEVIGHKLTQHGGASPAPRSEPAPRK